MLVESRRALAADIILILPLTAAAIASIVLVWRDLISVAGYATTAIAIVALCYKSRKYGVLVEAAVAAMLSVAIVALAIWVYDNYGSSFLASQWTLPLANGMELAAIEWGTIVLFGRLGLTYLTSIAKRKNARDLPVETIVSSLFEVLDWLSGPVETFLDKDQRAIAAGLFDSCGRAIRIGLLQWMGPPPTPIRDLISARLSRAAQATQGYGVWVLMPSKATRDDLRRHCLSVISAVELHEFDLLPDVSTAEVTRSEILEILGEYLRRLILTSLAPLAFYVAIKLRYLQDAQIRSSAAWFAFLWVAINLGQLLDAQISTKVTAVKDAATIIHPAPAAKK